MWLVVAFFSGIVAGIFVGTLWHNRKLHQISTALDCRKDKDEILNMKILREGKYAFLYDELNLLFHRTEYAVEALKQDKRDMKKYIADISHQLKTPLAAMITYLELLYRSETREKEKEVLYNCMYLSEKMDTLLRNLLDLARFEAEDIMLHYKECNITELLQKVIDDISLCIFQEKPEISYDSGDTISIIADEYWMFHALQNIVKNSIYYGGKPPKVVISLIDKKSFLEIQIVDNGKGISEDDKKNIFERFYRAGEKKRGGYGIGLALSKAIIEKHGGNLFVVNGESGGACFVAQLFYHIGKPVL